MNFDGMGRRCRHYDPLEGVRGGQDCKIGHPIRKIVTAANGGDANGLAFMLPCHPGPQRKADCPSYDPKTDAEREDDRKKMSAHMDKVVAGMSALSSLKAKMVSHQIPRAKATCPWCGEKDALRLSCAIGYNEHVHCRCNSCNMGIME